MRKFNKNNWPLWAAGGIAIIGFVILLFPPFNDWSFNLNEDLMVKFGTFYGGVFGTLVALLTLLFFYINFRESQKHWETQRNSQIFFSMLEDYHKFIDGLPNINIPDKGIVVGKGPFKYIAEILLRDSGNKQKLKNSADYFEKIYSNYLNNFFLRIELISQKALEFDSFEKHSFFVEYSKAILDSYQKLIIATYYLYDKDFKYKDLIDKYGLIDFDKDFESNFQNEEAKKKFLEPLNRG